jgi:DNA-binding MarR family transcriptional regulator
MEDKMGNEQWVTMTEAAEALGITPTQVSRLAKKGAIRAEADALNQRVKLVELNEVTRGMLTSKKKGVLFLAVENAQVSIFSVRAWRPLAVISTERISIL